MRDNKNASSRRTVVLFLIAAACVLAFALVMGAGLAAAQAKESGALHTAAQAPSAQTAAAFDGLDVLVTATSGGVEEV